MGSHMHPRKVYQVLFPFKRYFRCAQAQHFLVFCWLVVALIRDPGKSTLKGLGASAFQAQILDDPADGSVGAMGRPSADDGDGRDHAPYAPATVGRRAVSYR